MIFPEEGEFSRYNTTFFANYMAVWRHFGQNASSNLGFFSVLITAAIKYLGIEILWSLGLIWRGRDTKPL